MNFKFNAITAITAFLSTAALFAGESIPFQTGDSVAFLGDSITQLGFQNKSGYVNLVADGLKQAGVEIKVIPAGISGNNSAHMVARVDKDVIAQKPAWMFLSCGVNDAPNGITGRGGNPGIPLNEYTKNITEILDKCAAAGIRVIILSATPVVEEPEHPANKNLISYNGALREIAAERNLPLIDLNKVCNKCIETKKFKDKRYYTVDGTHMNPRGDIVLAIAILHKLNVPHDAIYKAYNSWTDRPDGWPYKMDLNFSIKEMNQISEIKPADMSMEEWTKSLILEKMNQQN